MEGQTLEVKLLRTVWQTGMSQKWLNAYKQEKRRSRRRYAQGSTFGLAVCYVLSSRQSERSIFFEFQMDWIFGLVYRDPEKKKETIMSISTNNFSSVGHLPSTSFSNDCGEAAMGMSVQGSV